MAMIIEGIRKMGKARQIIIKYILNKTLVRETF